MGFTLLQGRDSVEECDTWYCLMLASLPNLAAKMGIVRWLFVCEWSAGWLPHYYTRTAKMTNAYDLPARYVILFDW